MTFDFDKAIAEAAKDAKSTALEALVLGSSSSGKSSLFGTFGCKTLYLYSGGENHGVKSAYSTGATNVIAAKYDVYKEDGKIDPDASLANCLSALSQPEILRQKGVGAVAIDGASELEVLIRSSKAWLKACMTPKGSHNAFEETKATLAGFRPIITALKDLQRELGIHFAMSCILDVKELGSMGEVVEGAPKIQGYSVAESLCQQFGDVLVVGRMTKNGVAKHKLQFGTDLSKVAKEESGAPKKFLNFSPRIAGIKVADLPPYEEADLSKIIALKQAKFGVNECQSREIQKVGSVPQASA